MYFLVSDFKLYKEKIDFYRQNSDKNSHRI